MRLVGTIRPRLRSVIAAEVSGLVAEYPVDIGDEVRKGQIVCKLRSVTRVAEHAEAVSRLAELDAALEEANAMLDKAVFESQRMTALWEEKRATEKEYTDARADHRAAAGRARQAENALNTQKAVVEVLADNLSQTEIRAPFDGVVVTKRTEVGAWVEQGGEIAELVDLSIVRARVNVPEAIIGHCKVGCDALVRVDALKSDHSAKITRVVPDADERARTFPVEVDVENPQRELRAGMFVSVAMPSGPSGKRLVVPKDAVVVRGAGRILFVVREGEKGATAMPVPVSIISEVRDLVAVEASGLSAGDRVVIRGNEYMFAPGPVVVVSDTAAAVDDGGATKAAVHAAATQPSDEG